MSHFHQIEFKNDKWLIDLDQFGAFVLMEDRESEGNSVPVFFVRCHYRVPNNERFLDIAPAQPDGRVRKNAEGILAGIMSRVVGKHGPAAYIQEVRI